MSENRVFVTSALPYVNNVPHLGNLIGSVLSGDCYARFRRLMGHEVIFISGTDEYGTPTSLQALKENVEPIEICHKYHAIHKEVYEWMNCSFDMFGRTTHENHTKVCQKVFGKLVENKLVSSHVLDQLYCETCHRFLADRYVEGICNCGSISRGDQCDSCGKLIDPLSLKDPVCKICSKGAEVRSSKHLYLDLPSLSEKLEIWQESVIDSWSSNAKAVTLSWMKTGLTSRCITRDNNWGIAVPLEEYKDKTIYVWIEAVFSYYSILKTYSLQHKLPINTWLKNPNVEFCMFMGKDNIPFHSVILPALLIGSQSKFPKPTKLFVTEYLNYENSKFSKSLNNGIFCTDCINMTYPSYVWRFYLFFIRPETHDTNFQWDHFKHSNNGILLGKIGNFSNRVLKLYKQNFPTGIANYTLTSHDNIYITRLNDTLQTYVQHMLKAELKAALDIIIQIVTEANQKLTEDEPWKLINSNILKSSTSIILATNIIFCLTRLLYPFVPTLSNLYCKQLNIPEITNLTTYAYKFEFTIKQNHILTNDITPLIPKITDEDIKKYKKQYT